MTKCSMFIFVLGGVSYLTALIFIGSGIGGIASDDGDGIMLFLLGLTALRWQISEDRRDRKLNEKSEDQA